MMGRGEKALWTLLMIVLVGLELRTLYLDRNEHDREQAYAACERLERFGQIADKMDSAISTSQSQFNATMDKFSGDEQVRQQQFNATIEKSNKIVSGVQNNLDAVTGSNSFPEFFVAMNQGSGNPVTYPMDVFIYGKYPIRNLHAEIQQKIEGIDNESIIRQIQSMHSLPIEGDMIPGARLLNERLGIGEYFIHMWSAGGQFEEELELRLDDKGQLLQSYKITKDGKTLSSVKDNKLIIRPLSR
jgi:hypothetical protein